MLNALLRGAIAGCSGTIALDVATYLDMFLRGRPASQVPTKVAAALADRADVTLAPDPRTAQNRQSALGALLGYGNGVAIGMAWGAASELLPVWWRDRTSSQSLAAVVLAGLAMAASDVPSVGLGATDPSSWGPSGWLADVVPHLVYGAVTVATLHTLEAR